MDSGGGGPKQVINYQSMNYRAVCFALLILISLAAFQTQDQVLTFRVMSYNIHHGEGNDGKIDVGRIAQLIKAQKADLVGLQEVDKGVARTGGRDIPGELAQLTGMTAFFVNNFHFQGGEYGNAVLSRFPFESRTNTHYRMLRKGEQRGLLQTVVSVGGRKLVFMTTHLDFRPADDERMMNVDEIFRTAETYKGVPVVVCGDFNDFPESRVYARMKERFQDAWESAGKGPGWTFSSNEPRRRIDYVWFSKGSNLEALSAWVVSSPASDHMPLVVEFKMR